MVQDRWKRKRKRKRKQKKNKQSVPQQTVPQQNTQGVLLRQTVKSVNKFYESTRSVIKQQTVQSTVLRYLIPDLAGLVSKYCWPADRYDIHKHCRYGNYEAVSTYNCEGVNLSWSIAHARVGGYEKVEKLIILRVRERDKKLIACRARKKREEINWRFMKADIRHIKRGEIMQASFESFRENGILYLRVIKNT